MKPIEIESWVQAVVRRLGSTGLSEDARVELKSAWLSPETAARQIAGHANSAHGEFILWVVGLDEKAGVVGAPDIEFSNWWNQVKAEFDGLVPSVTPLNVPIDEKVVVGLLFDTSRFPYVVRNPKYGTKDGGPVQLEVPWREGNATRSARREDLIELLAPIQRLPRLELLAASLTIFKPEQRDASVRGTFFAQIYLIPIGEGLLVIPFHRCKVEISIPANPTESQKIRLSPPERLNMRARSTESRSLTIAASGDELIAEGPGRTHLSCQFRATVFPEVDPGPARVEVKLWPVHTSAPITFEVVLDSPLVHGPGKCSWEWRGSTFS